MRLVASITCATENCIILPYKAGPILTTHFFFNDTATSEIYTLSLHDALPISMHLCVRGRYSRRSDAELWGPGGCESASARPLSHPSYVSYPRFCWSEHS